MTRWLLPEELEHYEPVSRSMRIEGYSTSVRLERVFWDVLDHMAVAQQVSTCSLVSAIYREVHAGGEAHTNFSSVLRVICLRHLECGASQLPLGHTAAARRTPAPNAMQVTSGRPSGVLAPDAQGPSAAHLPSDPTR